MAVQEVNNQNFLEKCWDNYITMPIAKQDDTIFKVLLVASIAGIITLVVFFPLAPVVPIVAGLGTFLYITDKYSVEECTQDLLSNVVEYMQRSKKDPSFAATLARRGVNNPGQVVKGGAGILRKFFK